MSALRALPEEARGWQDARRSVQCQSCRAVMVFEAARVGQNCEFCGSPALVDYTEIKAPIRPQCVLPFRVDANRVRDEIRRWWRSKWFAPGTLARRALVDTVHSLYIPYWTFDAQVHCPWDAEAGHYYYVPVTHIVKGRPTVRMERRIRWVPASGAVDTFFDDEAVPGTQGLRPDLLRRIEPFPTREVVPYDTAFLSGHIVEHYRVVLLEASQRAQEQMHARLEQLCAQQVPGDTHRNLRIQPDYSHRTFKHVLVPVWVLSYNHGARAFQVLVNGYTGTIAGEYPKSVWKIVLLVVAAVLAALIVASLSDNVIAAHESTEAIRGRFAAPTWLWDGHIATIRPAIHRKGVAIMNTRIARLVVLGASLMAAVVVATVGLQAHHAVAGVYDLNKEIVLEGRLKKLNFVNPHANIELSVPDKKIKGKVVDWVLTTASVQTLTRQGVTKDAMRPGEPLKVTVLPARNGNPAGFIRNLQLGDKNILLFFGDGTD